jgi:hypothetical protein
MLWYKLKGSRLSLGPERKSVKFDTVPGKVTCDFPGNQGAQISFYLIKTLILKED